MHYVYIHGFNSSSESRSGKALRELLAEPVLCVSNDYSEPFSVCLGKLEKQISAVSASGKKLCIMGTSLGGFYALQLRLPNIARIAAWNPVLFPSLQLAAFVGENERFTDGRKWYFSREALLSYAASPDPRVWKNFAWQQKSGKIGSCCPARKIFLGDHDELLDHEISQAFWSGHAEVEVISSGHSIACFQHSGSFLKPGPCRNGAM